MTTKTHHQGVKRTCVLTKYEAMRSQHKPRRSSPELEEHAALLLPLRDHLEGVQAAVAPVAVPAAERDERTVEAVVPGSILVHVPEAVLICTHCKTNTRHTSYNYTTTKLDISIVLKELSAELRVFH